MERSDVVVGGEDLDRARTFDRLEFDAVVMESQCHFGGANAGSGLTELVAEALPRVERRRAALCRGRSSHRHKSIGADDLVQLERFCQSVAGERDDLVVCGSALE